MKNVRRAMLSIFAYNWELNLAQEDDGPLVAKKREG